MKFDTQKLNDITTVLIQNVFGETVLGVRNLFGLGSVNFTAAVTTDKKVLIVRLNIEDGIENYRKEKWAIHLAVQQGVPAPEVLYVGELDGVAASVFPFVEGHNGTLHPDKTIIWHYLGDYAKRTHDIDVPGFGEALSNEDTWQSYLQYNIDSLTQDDDLIKLGILHQASSQLLKDTFTRLSQTTLQFGLSHGDLSERNTIVDAQGKVWLIDWGNAGVQVVPHFDFDGVLSSNVAADTLEFASFLAGYGMTRERFEKLHPQIQDFSLLQATDKLRWAIDRKPERIENYARRLEQKIK